MNDLVTCTLAALPALFLVVDPVGAVPVLVAMTASATAGEKRAIARRAALGCAVVLAAFAVAGGALFASFGITLAGFRITGGLLLARTAMHMVDAQHLPACEASSGAAGKGRHRDPSFFPLCVPLLAGPGALATVLVLTSRHPGWGCTAAVLVAIVLTAVATWLLLRAAPRIGEWLSPGALEIVTRLMGLVLAAISVEFVIAGIREVVTRAP